MLEQGFGFQDAVRWRKEVQWFCSQQHVRLATIYWRNLQEKRILGGGSGKFQGGNVSCLLVVMMRTCEIYFYNHWKQS